MEIKRLYLYQKCKIHPEETDIKDVAGCELCFLIKRLAKKGFVAVSVEDLKKWQSILSINAYSFMDHRQIAEDMKKYLLEAGK